MGFVRDRVFKITWDDGSDLHGLEVRARPVSMGEFLNFQEHSEKVSDGDIDATKTMLELFSRFLLSWNLETEDGEPVPATLEGLYSQDLPFVLDVALKWMDVAAGVPDDLGKASTSGEPSLEASIPMETLSVDLPQLAAQN